MTQYEIQNAIFAVDGYYVPRAGESPASAFLRAKVEAQNALKDRVAHIESITFPRWEATRNHDQPEAAPAGPDWAVLGPRLAEAVRSVEGLLYEAQSDIPAEMRAKRDVLAALEIVRANILQA